MYTHADGDGHVGISTFFRQVSAGLAIIQRLMGREIWLRKQKFSLADQNFGSVKQDSPNWSCESGCGPRDLGLTDTKSG
jgi:hypothetical protein